MNHPHVGAHTARTKLAPLALELHENLHRFAPAGLSGHLLALTKYCRKCHSLVWMPPEMTTTDHRTMQDK